MGGAVPRALSLCHHNTSEGPGLISVTTLPLDGGAVTCLSTHTSDQMRIMVRDLADSATLGGTVALSTSGTRATSGSRLRKSNNKLSGGIQTKMACEEFDEATVA